MKQSRDTLLYNITKTTMKTWREAAGIIVAARNVLKQNKSYDYDLLLLKRQQKAKFGGSFVFPGGLIESADASLQWKNLFKNCGHNDNNFKFLFPNANRRPDIFQSKNNELPREISLRISAIRETFEECGILLCKKSSDTTISKEADHFPLSHEQLENWQEKVHKDANEFYNMCKELNCYPNLWALHEWGNWLTPTFFPASQRFNSIFFFACLPQIPPSKLDTGEMDQLMWATPDHILSSLKNSMMPPQIYEITKIAKFKNLTDLMQYAEEKGKKGIRLYFPVRVSLLDGTVYLYPDDSEYPEIVDLHKEVEIDKSDMTIKEFRDASTVIHRAEYKFESEPSFKPKL